jgi:hypothetical protein
MRSWTPIIATAVAAAALLAAAGCEEDDGKHECEVGREQGDGYPSACVPEDGCADGAVCGAVSASQNVGVCARPCAADADCAVDLPCTAVGRCNLEHAATGEMLCSYACSTEADCPINMTCAEFSTLKLCYPAL